VLLLLKIIFWVPYPLKPVVSYKFSKLFGLLRSRGVSLKDVFDFRDAISKSLWRCLYFVLWASRIFFVFILNVFCPLGEGKPIELVAELDLRRVLIMGGSISTEDPESKIKSLFGIRLGLAPFGGPEPNKARDAIWKVEIKIE
jgi:hypothetical protein